MRIFPVMCGIVGAIRRSGGVTAQLVKDMALRIAYRGPDSSAEWVEKASRVAFGHRRLSILDLSPTGAQPMSSSSGRYTITFGGEVFNYKELSKKITSKPIGSSDTAVMLECFEAFGVERAVENFVGMFAFAVWDELLQTVTLVRDRLGKKPLYFGWVGDLFTFTSDQRALSAIPGWRPDVSTTATALYMQLGYVPSPVSIFSSMRKLDQAHILTIDVNTLETGYLPSPKSYWSLPTSDPDIGLPHRCSDPEVTTTALEQLLTESVKMRLVSDVPIGAFLSGGIDSSLIVALMQNQIGYPVNTFSIGFHESEYDEAPFARSVAKHLCTNHTELLVTDRMALDCIHKLPQIVDEPLGDPSLIPTFIVSKLAREYVTVSLSGDGGDELFGGYDRYNLLGKLLRVREYFPNKLRGMVCSIGEHFPLSLVDFLQSILKNCGLFPFELTHPGEKVRRTLSLLKLNSVEEFYYTAITHWRDGRVVVKDSANLNEMNRLPCGKDPRRYMAQVDQQLYLPNDILMKVDRASMANSLEARTPLLDHRVVEFAANIPTSMLYLDGRGKWPLRKLLARYIPLSLIDRPKRGFGIPLDQWLRGELREWADNLLETQALEEGGLIAKPIRNMWHEQVHRGRNHSQLLWNVLVYQDWIRQL